MKLGNVFYLNIWKPLNHPLWHPLFVAKFVGSIDHGEAVRLRKEAIKVFNNSNSIHYWVDGRDMKTVQVRDYYGRH